MNKPDKKVSKPSLLLNYSVIIASIVVILAGLRAASSVLGPFLMAAFFAVLLISPVHWLQKRGVSGGLSLTVVIFGVLVIGGGAATLIGSQIAQFARDIPEYRHRFIVTLENHNLDLSAVFPFLKEDDDKTPEGESEEQDGSENQRPSGSRERTLDRLEGERQELTTAAVYEPVAAKTLEGERADAVEADVDAANLDAANLDEANAEVVNGVENSANRLTLPKTPEILKEGGLFSEDAPPSYDDEYVSNEQEEGKDSADSNPAITAVKLSSQQLFGFLAGLAGELSYFASAALTITLLLVFMLLETAKIPRKLVVALGERKFSNTHMLKVVEDIRNYMAIKTGVSLLVGFFVTILLVVSNVQYPLLWGFVAFLLNYIPNIGSVVAAIPPVVLATVEHGLVTGCVDAAFLVLINCVIGYVLEPRLLGEGLDLSPLIVLLALIFFGWLLGPVGMFLSPPLAVIMKIIFQSFPETRWIAVLMANSIPRDDDQDDDEPSSVKA